MTKEWEKNSHGIYTKFQHRIFLSEQFYPQGTSNIDFVKQTYHFKFDFFHFRVEYSSIFNFFNACVCCNYFKNTSIKWLDRKHEQMMKNYSEK